jgi:beta-carotene ketolase (CrtW type)
MQTYSTPSQYAKICGWVALLLACRAPFFNIVLYVAAAPITAAVRLFYFGTYLPHLPPNPKEVMHWPKSHSDDNPAWVTFLKCYHFGYHWEHHRFPYAPWWDLPRCKALLRQVEAQEAAAGKPA